MQSVAPARCSSSLRSSKGLSRATELLGWRGAGQWLLLGPGNRIRPLHDVSRELGSAGGFPRVAGWCCAG